MSYLVLARKYRPQTFAEVVGQEHVTRTLGNAIEKGRVHHAFLFCGARGVGKTTAARILAKCLSCANAPTATPCNACEACNEITSGTSVDVQEIDGASNNSVDDVRTLRENVRYLPVRGKKKVYIIDEVHMLSSGAFNALLKTLEEPPAHAVFIFATTEAHKIPITILSRLQRYDFRLVPSPRIVAHLAKVLTDEKIAFDERALQVVAREAGGSVRDALSLLEQVLAAGVEDGKSAISSEQAAADALGVADRSLIGDLGRAILARDAATALALVGAAAERSVDWKQLAHSLLEQLRNLVVARVVEDAAPLIEASATEIEDLKAQAKAAPAGLLELLFDRFAKVADEVTLSPLPRYVLEVGLVELTHVEPLEPVGELVERLEQIESRLGSGGGARAATPAPRAATPARAATAAEPARAAPAKPVAPPAAPPATAKPSARPTSWTALAEALFEKSHRFACLLTGKEVSFAPPKLVVAFKNTFEADQARDKLGEALPLMKELLGGAVTVEIEEGAGKAPSALEADDLRLKAERDQRRQEALDHPARKLVADRFGDGVTFKEPEVK